MSGLRCTWRLVVDVGLGIAALKEGEFGAAADPQHRRL